MIYAYAGIGTTTCSEKEKDLILKISNKMSERFICYSGNALGSDITFQKGSNKKCVIFLPWKTYNINEYNPKDSLDYYVLGNDKEGLESVRKFHKYPHKLTKGGFSMMSRNYYQVMGYSKYPKISCIICCADYHINEISQMEVEGGTGQAVRIANSLNIPIVNIRHDKWLLKLNTVIDNLKKGINNANKTN